MPDLIRFLALSHRDEWADAALLGAMLLGGWALVVGKMWGLL